MSSIPPEPEKYSLDEMLDRLQSKPDTDPADSGELVTRSDGTQAIKVRKRKRRSTQPHKEAAKKSARSRVILISAAVVLLMLAVISLGGLFVYANSAPYRNAVVEKISKASGATTKLHQFRVNPISAETALAEFKWPEGHLFKTLSLTGVQTKALLLGMVGGPVSLNEINVNSGTIQLGRGQKGASPLLDAKSESPLTFERLGVAKGNIIIGDPTQPVVQVLQSEISFYPQNINGKPNVRLFRGDLKIPDWPLFRIDRGLMEFNAGEVDIVNLRLLHETNPTGSIELSGRLDPYLTTNSQSLAVKINSFNLSGITGSSFGRLLDTRIDSKEDPRNQLTFSDSNPSGNLTVSFVAASGSITRLQGFPFLSILSQTMKNRGLAEPIFDSGGTGILTREKGVVRVSELTLISKDQLKIVGELMLQSDDSLSGILQVGVPDATVITSSDSRIRALFSESRDAHRWVTLKISGTGSRPIDNLEEIYEAASGSPSSKPSGDLFEDLTNPGR